MNLFVYVYAYVFPPAYPVRDTLVPNFTKFSTCVLMLSVAMARSFSDSSRVIHYVLSVLWTTPCFHTTGNESVPIQFVRGRANVRTPCSYSSALFTQCRFPALAIFNAKIKLYFSVLSDSTRKLLRFEITKMLTAD